MSHDLGPILQMTTHHEELNNEEHTQHHTNTHSKQIEDITLILNERFVELG